MKKLFLMLIVLFILYLGIQFMFSWFSTGQDNNYQLEAENITFDINEKADYTGEEDNYRYTVKSDDLVYRFQIFHNYGKLPKVLKEIKYFKNDTNTCILPIFKEDLVLMDMLCYREGNLTYYYNIKGQDKELDEYVKKLKNYDQNQFVDSKSSEEIEHINVFKENLVKDHFIGITNYRGIYNISDNFNSIVYKISLYNNDIYNQKIGIFVDSYYISADYNKDHEFNKLNIIDLVHIKDNKITSNDAISFDSYIQGVVDGKVYLYDKDSKIQYEIDVAKKSIVKYSSNSIHYYKNGEWTTMTIAEANDETKFSDAAIDYTNDDYDRIDKVGGAQGYYYLYKKNGQQYDVYRVDSQNKEGLIYLFSTKNIDSICYVDGYVYYVNGDKIQAYHDSFGIRTMVQYSELEFNKNLNFNVYSR